MHLLHMRDAAQLAQEFVQERKREDLDNDQLLQMGLAKAVELVGESANQVSDQRKLEHSEIPWQDIVDMRHILVHNYWRIELDVVWDAVKNDIPQLIKQLQPLIESVETRHKE